MSHQIHTASHSAEQMTPATALGWRKEECSASAQLLSEYGLATLRQRVLLMSVMRTDLGWQSRIRMKDDAQREMLSFLIASSQIRLSYCVASLYAATSGDAHHYMNLEF
jgi:hypothetical protein